CEPLPGIFFPWESRAHQVAEDRRTAHAIVSPTPDKAFFAKSPEQNHQRIEPTRIPQGQCRGRCSRGHIAAPHLHFDYPFPAPLDQFVEERVTNSLVHWLGARKPPKPPKAVTP